MNYPFTEPPETPRLPPLRIHHIMLCMAVCAVMLTILKAGANQGPNSNSLEARSLLYLLVSGISLTGLALGLYWKSKGLPFFDEPGQMAYILHGIGATYTVVSTSLLSFSQQNMADAPLARYVHLMSGLFGFVIAIVQLVLYFHFARKFQTYGWWDTFFYALGIITILQFLASCVLPFFFVFTLRAGSGNELRVLGMIQMAVPLLFQTAILICNIIAMRTDLQAQTEYHWTHWLGAATWPAVWLATIISTLSLYFFPPEFLQKL